jgi:hypothetical protein
MSTAEISRQWANIATELREQGPAIALRMAQTGLTLVKERSINEGISVDGQKAEYTTKEGYKSGLKSKALNASGRSYAGSGGKGNWQGLRAAQGMKTDAVNLSYTNRMWTAIRPVQQVQVGNRYLVFIGCSDAGAFATLMGNIKRYGNFMKLTDGEAQLVRQDAADDVGDIINKYIR